MNILQVTNGYPPQSLGGVEIYTHDLAQGLTRSGHRVTVFCHHSDLALPDYHTETATIDDVEVYRVVNDHKQSIAFRDTFADTQVEAIFRKFVVRLQPEIIHFNHFIGLSARLPLIANELGIPFLVTLHDFWPICHQVRLIDRLGRSCPGQQAGGDCPDCIRGGSRPTPQLNSVIRLAKWALSPQARRRLRAILFRGKAVEAQPSALLLADGDLEMRSALFQRAILSAAHVLVPSAYVRERYAANGYPGERIEILPLGIDMEPQDVGARSKAGRSEAIVFAAIGAFIPTKGFHTLIEAFRATPGENLRLRLYGRDDVDAAYTQTLKRLAGHDARIAFMGAFPPEQRRQVYESIDVLVLPAMAPESFSLVVREALIHGRPVIAARIGALPEIVIDQVNGFLFEAGNAPKLAQILTRITQDSESLARLNLPGPVPILSVDEHTRQVEAFYNKALDG
jgi:glycosyltransferase involved in cell wall biosynthesis